MRPRPPTDLVGPSMSLPDAESLEEMLRLAVECPTTTSTDVEAVNRGLDMELKSGERKLEVQVREFARFVHVVRQWREAIAALVTTRTASAA